MTFNQARRDALYADAAQLDAMASFLRYAADVDLSTLYKAERQALEGALRARIKATIEILVNNMPA